MTPERFKQVEALYRAAREKAADERATLFAQVDAELRAEVESLLATRAGGEWIDRPAMLDAASLLGNSEVTVGAVPRRLGPYQIDSKLGQGGMGEVYRAVDTRLGRAVAIKTISEQFSARFEREARAISSLNHPHICTLYDVGPNYLVMELIEGETIAARLERGPLPIKTAVLFGGQILAALVEAHEKRILHRDLKPGNIMIAKSGIKVLDFGLAKSGQDDTLTASHIVMGTPAYMAPEQRAGKPADARSDIYSFGCVLYEMLTGTRVTFQRRRIASRTLEALVNRCLEESPARRWQSAVELQQRLAAVSSGVRANVAQQRRPKPSPARKIVLGEFENKTGDPAFDGILRQGLSVQLEQSPFLALVSDQQIRHVLQLMSRPSETRLTPEIAQEICERTGGTAVLEGSVASLGGEYVLWLRARSCASGEIIGQEQAQVGKKEHLLQALTDIAAQIRARLGESLASIREHSTPLEEATTPSLEALKAYSVSRTTVFSRGFAPAIPNLQRAIALDPQFAMALADLGFYYWNMGQTDLGAEYVRKAYELRDRVSEPERLFIHFLYDRQVTGNLQKELEVLEAWAQSYPSNWTPWGLLAGWGTRGTGQYERGIQAAERALRLNPDLTLAYISLFDHNLGLGRLRDASAAMGAAAARHLELPSFLICRFYSAFLAGDDAGMRREIDRARGSLETEDWMAHNQAMVLARSGQMRHARTHWRHTIERVRLAGEREKAAIYQAAEAVCEAHLGNRDYAKERAATALELGKGRDVEYAAAFALALSGDSAGSERLTDDLAERFPEDTPVQFEYLPTLRALLALAHGAPTDAIEHLQAARPYDLAMPGTAFFAKFGGLYPVYVRGLAFLEAGRAREAVAEFQKVLDHRGIVLADPIGALGHVQLGRALAALGESERARPAYDAFFTLWKDADSGIPVLEDAKTEYAALQ